MGDCTIVGRELVTQDLRPNPAFRRRWSRARKPQESIQSERFSDTKSFLDLTKYGNPSFVETVNQVVHGSEGSETEVVSHLRRDVGSAAEAGRFLPCCRSRHLTVNALAAVSARESWNKRARNTRTRL